MKLMFFVILVAACFNAVAGDFKIHIHPEGDDKNKGYSEIEAVATLQRAIDLAEGVLSGPEQIIIVVHSGRYRYQHVQIAGSPYGIPLLITGDRAKRPVFDGGEQAGVWMTIKFKAEVFSKIIIEGFEVKNYYTAIDVKGSRNIPEKVVAGIVIRNNKFINIGNFSDLNGKPSTAAIRLVNSDMNMIIKNEFVHIGNIKSCGLMHSVYLAHGSAGNLIENNSFVDACGDSIRFRDQSNNNVVRNNRFVDAWANSPVSEWYCNQSKRSDCTKSAGECPSLNNLIEGNEMVAIALPQSEIYRSFDEDVPSGCVDGMRVIIK